MHLKTNKHLKYWTRCLKGIHFSFENISLEEVYILHLRISLAALFCNCLHSNNHNLNHRVQKIHY